jgi:hypothetical protein
LSVPVPVPASTRTRNPRVTSHGSRRVRVSSGVLLTKIHLFNYILNYNYQTTLRAGARRHGVDRRWARDARLLGQRNERKRKKEKSPGEKCLLGLSPRRSSFALLPNSFVVAGYAGGLDAGGVVVFVVVVSPHRPLTVRRLLIAVVVVPSSSPPMEHPASSCSQRCHCGPTPDDVAHGVAL